MKNLRVNCCETTGSPGRHLTRFTSHDVSNTTTLLLSEGGDMLYVGARDAVLALDVSHKDAIILKNKVGKRPLWTDPSLPTAALISSTEVTNHTSCILNLWNKKLENW